MKSTEVIKELAQQLVSSTSHVHQGIPERSQFYSIQAAMNYTGLSMDAARDYLDQELSV